MKDEPLVVAALLAFGDEDVVDLERRLKEIDPAVEVHATPYMESRVVRAEKGKDGGRLLSDYELPLVDETTLDIWRRAQVVVSIDSPDNHRETMPNLRLFQACSAGMDHIDIAGMRDRGVSVASGAGIGSVGVAEFVLSRFLQVWKHHRNFDEQQRTRRWEQVYGTELTGKTLLIVGFGTIGREIAKRAKAFDLHVIATRRSAQPGDTADHVDELRHASELAELLPRADAIVSVLPASPETADLFDAAMFAAMKPGVLFQNVGRGPHVVETDLIAALESGHIGAAMLDVTRLEPLPTDSPLWEAPNLYLSPHSAVSLDRYQTNSWDLVVENFGRWKAGQPLINEQ